MHTNLRICFRECSHDRTVCFCVGKDREQTALVCNAYVQQKCRQRMAMTRESEGRGGETGGVPMERKPVQAMSRSGGQSFQEQDG